MGYKDENIKHRQGIALPSKTYTCPHCGGTIRKKAFMVVCPSCKKVVKGADLK